MLPDPTQVNAPPGARQVIPTPDSTDGEATHPSVVYVPETLGGFAYWMAMTPYAGGDDEHEDPCILASHNGSTWGVPSGLVNPIDDQPGSPGAYNSDVDLRHYDGVLYLFWRTYDPASVGTEEKLYFSTSIDGRVWSTKVNFYTSAAATQRLVSPCLLFEGGAWAMWAVDIIPSPNQVVKLQGGAAPTDAWSSPVGVDMGVLPEGKEPWHLGIISTADGYVGLLNDCDQDLSGINGLLYFITSEDGIEWENSGSSIIPQVQDGEYTQLYRATLLPEVENGVSGWRVWYGAWRIESVPIWHIYRTFASVPVAPPPVDPVAPPVGEAVATPFVEWIACDLVTGNKVAYLNVSGTISRALGTYTSDTLTVPAPLAGPLAMGGILGQAVGPDEMPTRMLVCVVNNVPAWAGIIWKVRGGSAGTIELGCATPESYFDRRYTGDLAYTETDQSYIAAGLAAVANVEGIGLEIDATATGILRDRTYWDDEDATVYQRLQELMDIEDGPEWTIDPDWRDERQQSVRLIFRVKSRIGSEVPRGPLSTQSASVTDYSVTYDYGKGMGANDVLAYSSGEGEDRPESVHIRNELALSSGVPRVEHRWSPSSAIKNEAILNSHASSALRRLDGGTTSIEVTARWDVEPARLGIDLLLGDDIDFSLTGHMHPTGISGTGRMVGWRFNTTAGTFVPVLRR